MWFDADGYHMLPGEPVAVLGCPGREFRISGGATKAPALYDFRVLGTGGVAFEVAANETYGACNPRFDEYAGRPE